MKITLTTIMLIFSALAFSQQHENEVLLIGTFHFNNPGHDVAQVKTLSVLTEKCQKELENIANKVKKYKPSKIFVEWPYNKQQKLDSLYNLYLKGEYFDYVALKFPKKTFYTENEIIQLAFRAAKKLGLEKVYAIDNQDVGDFPYDSLMKEIDNAGQIQLKKEIEADTKMFEKQENLNMATKTLTEILLDMNLDVNRKADLASYISQFNRAGGKDNFVGAYLNGEWYRRNLYMYASLQKNIAAADKRVMVLLGSSHIAMFKYLIEMDHKLKSKELSTILK